jgi:hypothetical protein
MLGPPKPRCLDQPIAASLEELVPADNVYRHLEVKLDLSFVRQWVRELYAERGRPSIDPVVFFKLLDDLFAGEPPTDDGQADRSNSESRTSRGYRGPFSTP